jgi:hypothetical protein
MTRGGKGARRRPDGGDGSLHLQGLHALHAVTRPDEPGNLGVAVLCGHGIGLPFAIGAYFFDQRKERENEEEAIWQQLSDAYIDFLEVVLANSDLKLRSQIATPNSHR